MYFSFDLELSRLIEAHGDERDDDLWDQENSPKITCIATYDSELNTTKSLCTTNRGKIQQTMSTIDIERFIDVLWKKKIAGYTLITWGGVSVDFKALFSSTKDEGRREKCVQLLMESIDIPIASATDIGMMMSLDAASKSLGVGRKNTEFSLRAPEMWKEGRFQEVLDHVKTDAYLTGLVYKWMMEMNPPSLTWITQKGYLKQWKPSYILTGNESKRLKTVKECYELPLPFTPFVPPRGMNRDFSCAWLKQKNQL